MMDNKPPTDDEMRSLMVRYLSGNLPDSERDPWEEKLLTDSNLSDAAAWQEQQLIDDYARGTLSADEHTALSPWIERSPRRLERVAMTRAFFAPRPESGPRSRPGKVLRPTIIATTLAIAASLLITIAIVRPHPAPIPSTASAPVVTPPVVAELHKPETILLIAEHLRGESAPLTYPVTPGSPIQILILLPDDETASHYQIQLTGPATTLHRDGITVEHTVSHQSLHLDLPAGSLRPGAYQAAIHSTSSSFTIRFNVATR